MTADDLMRLIGRYVEACDDLGDGLFEKPLTTTDALHAKACGLHGQILAEVYRLHAEAGEAHRLRESERVVQAARLEWARAQLAKVNNEFGSENADWPDAWRRVAEVKERAETIGRS